MNTGPRERHEFGIDDISHAEEELKLPGHFSMS